MKTSGVCSTLSVFAFFGACAAAVMVPISGIYYWFTESDKPDYNFAPHHGTWLIFTGYGWIKAAILLGVAAGVLSVVSSVSRKIEAKQESDARAREAAARKREQDARDHELRQTQLKNQIENANSTAVRLLDSLPGHLDSATKDLQQAEIDWEEHVYNPFWTSIESCACSLAEFKSAIAGIIDCAQQYRGAASEYEGVAAPFAVTSISVEAMNAYRTIYDIMARFTRRAQADRDFANIFELWRGNAIMESGFANLRSAIQVMSREIASQIASLDSSLDGVSRAINFQTQEVTGALAHQTSTNMLHHGNVQKILQESLRHEKKIADRLWNIERGYKPVL